MSLDPFEEISKWKHIEAPSQCVLTSSCRSVSVLFPPHADCSVYELPNETTRLHCTLWRRCKFLFKRGPGKYAGCFKENLQKLQWWTFYAIWWWGTRNYLPCDQPSRCRFRQFWAFWGRHRETVQERHRGSGTSQKVVARRVSGSRRFGPYSLVVPSL